MNAKLADHAGELWARLDMAGCELLPGSSHAETLAQVEWASLCGWARAQGGCALVTL